jgi:sulfur-carrier protein
MDDDASVDAERGTVTVRLFAAARAAASGRDVVEVPAGRLDALVAELAAAHPPRLAEVLSVSTLVCDGVRLDATCPMELAPGAVIDVLPPFAGG